MAFASVEVYPTIIYLAPFTIYCLPFTVYH
jgi:hypothetical protein